MTAKRSRDIRYGNDLYREISSPKAKKPLKVTYWDLWIAVVLVHEFDGDWDKLRDHFRAQKSGHSFRRYKAEELMHHLRMLRQTLDQVGLAAEDVLSGADPDLLKKQRRKAKRKVLEMEYQGRERSAWMTHTPRKQREARAMRGYWGHFPASPKEYAGALEGLYKSSGWYSEDQSFGLERKLSAFLDKREERASPVELFALYRAFVTVVVEKMDLVDDSYGVIGELCQQVFEGYVQLDRTALDMPLDIFFQDLIELMIWEDYAFTDTGRPIFFTELATREIPLVESVLKEQWSELRDLELDYQAEEALTMLGMLYRGQLMFDQFISMAKVMGARAWQRITTMSEMAEEHGKYDLVVAVYEACLGPGMHEDFLRKKYQELKSRLGLI